MNRKHKLAFWGIGAVGVTGSVVLGDLLAAQVSIPWLGKAISVFLILCLGAAFWGASADVWIWEDDDK